MKTTVDRRCCRLTMDTSDLVLVPPVLAVGITIDVKVVIVDNSRHHHNPTQVAGDGIERGAVRLIVDSAIIPIEGMEDGVIVVGLEAGTPTKVRTMDQVKVQVQGQVLSTDPVPTTNSVAIQDRQSLLVRLRKIHQAHLRSLPL